MAETLPSCATRLLQAKLALHKLNMGEQWATCVYSDGRQITFRANNIGELRLYIRDLEQECGDEDKRRRPFGIVW
jgi:hypothetical protein